jgi:DNA-binding response OmpR family regulator
VVRLLEARDDVDLVLFDLKMPGVQGLSGLVYMRAQYPASRSSWCRPATSPR